MSAITDYMQTLGRDARAAARQIAAANTGQKNAALLAMGDALHQARKDIGAANEQDLASGRESGLSDALMDRLELTPARIDAMIEGLQQVAALRARDGGVQPGVRRRSGARRGSFAVVHGPA